MELWIRSQDKECLMKINRLDYDLANGEARIMVNGYQTLVGKYNSKKRALAVLDEIQNYINNIYNKCIVGHNELVIYEMPEE